MGSIVFILGAGASHEAGAPLMFEFLDVVQSLLDSGELREREADFTRVLAARGVLQQAQSKAALDIHNVEEVFSAFEMASTLGRFGEYSREDIAALLTSMKVVIAETIERTMLAPSLDRGTKFVAPRPYGEFAELLMHFTSEAVPKNRVQVLTFNYDIGLDIALVDRGLHIDYGFETVTSRNSGMFVGKLHGSLNWARCPSCRQIVAWDVGTYWYEFCQQHWGAERAMPLMIGDARSRFRHPCEDLPLDAPYLVPPVLGKATYTPQLASVWARSAEALATADTIIVIGYSLPPTDAFFRYLFGIGSIGSNPLRRFWLAIQTGMAGCRNATATCWGRA